VNTPPSSPPAPASKLETAKKRPRSPTGTARATMSIQAGMRTPPTPVITSSMPSIRASESPGAGRARKNATAARPRNGSRSQIV
jgi:hypothetical protein